MGITNYALANMIAQAVGTSPDVIPTVERPKPAMCHLDRGSEATSTLSSRASEASRGIYEKANGTNLPTSDPQISPLGPFGPSVEMTHTWW